MSAHRTNAAHTTLVEELAAVVEGVAGVAFLKPGLADRLRSALPRPAPPAGRDRAAGLRMTLPDEEAGWRVEIHLVVDRRTRALDVTRTVRARVEDHINALTPGLPAPRVTVTVTGRV
jgi:hypothetical protein